MLPVWNVFFGLWVDVLFGQAKVDDVDDVFFFIPLPPDEEVFRFDISIDEIFWMHILHSWNLGKKEHKVKETPVFRFPKRTVHTQYKELPDAMTQIWAQT